MDRLSDPLDGLDEPALPKIREAFGPFASDEDLLLFLVMHLAAYQTFQKNRQPIQQRSRLHPVACLSDELMGRRDFKSVEVSVGESVSINIQN